jgi:hypothetical protein
VSEAIPGQCGDARCWCGTEAGRDRVDAMRAKASVCEGDVHTTRPHPRLALGQNALLCRGCGQVEVFTVPPIYRNPS